MNELFNINIKITARRSAQTAAMHTLQFITLGAKFKSEFKEAERRLGITVDESIKNKLQAEPGSVTVFKESSKPWFITFSSVDSSAKLSPDYFRNAVAGFIQQQKGKVTNEVEIVIPSNPVLAARFSSPEYFLQSFVEGVYYGNYVFNKYKTDKKEPENLCVTFLVSQTGKMREAVKSAGLLMGAVKFVRDLQNEPSAGLYPEAMARQISSEFEGLPVKVSVFDAGELKQRSIGGLLAVGAGSSHPPVMVVLEYKPAGAAKHAAIVGKGVTFDSGGISLKPAADMWEMKGDMSGAAVAAGTVMAAASAGLPVAITAVLPLAENMPSGSALKPGDIVTTSSGLTIEVDNTDAEGRIILSDALHYASGLKPDCIIDAATLTGACVVALGEFVAGLFTNNDDLAAKIFDSGLITNERVWRMPMWDDYKPLIKSDVADVKNVGGRWGGAITAAKFLEHWVDPSIPWAHIDLCPAGPHKLNNYSQPYFTGFGVRLLTDFLLKI